MNWTTRLNVSFAQEEDDSCEHIEAGIAAPYRLEREMDSFGPVAGFLMCKACTKAQDRNDSKHHNKIGESDGY